MMAGNAGLGEFGMKQVPQVHKVSTKLIEGVTDTNSNITSEFHWRC